MSIDLKEIIKRFKNGDDAAFEELTKEQYVTFTPLFMLICYRKRMRKMLYKIHTSRYML